MIYERHNCRLCEQPVKTALQLTPTPIANLFPDDPLSGECYPLELKQCIACGHVQIGHVIDDDALYGTAYKYATPFARKPALRAAAAELRAKYPKARNVVEIGSNNGIFLHSLHDEGFAPVIGIDPSGTDPLVWKIPFDIKAAHIVLRRIGLVDLIVANNVFAHIDDLTEVFKAVDELLSPDGALVFEVQYFASMADSGAFDMVYHEHRDYHTVRPLQAFLKRFGMVMTDWQILDTHGGSLRITAKRFGEEKPAPQESIDWQEFRQKIQEAKTSLLAVLPKRIAAFGAPAKAVTMIHHFGLQNRIAYCVDDTPQKQGKYIAGTSIPVVSRDVMMADKPRQMLLMSWNYEHLVRNSLPNVDFIVPFSHRLSQAA